MFEGRFKTSIGKLKNLSRDYKKSVQGSVVSTEKRDKGGRWGNVLKWGQNVMEGKVKGTLEGEGKREIMEAVMERTVPECTPTFKVREGRRWRRREFQILRKSL